MNESLLLFSEKFHFRCLFDRVLDTSLDTPSACLIELSFALKIHSLEGYHKIWKRLFIETAATKPFQEPHFYF